MKITHALFGAAMCLMFAAPISLAQTSPETPTTPPADTQVVDPPAAGEAPSVTPQAPLPPASGAAPQIPTPNAPAQSSAEAMTPTGDSRVACRTRKAEGEQCSCLSAPTTFGTARAAESGDRQVCMIPN